ncbi:MAG: hypothetical protein IT306_20030 [Chloroflexi bacterium]|nr:hypothetical protein [Chloroflexota bacterium]
MRDERSRDEDQHPGLRRSDRREQQRRKAQHGMRVGARPDTLRPVTVERVAKLTKRRKRR